MRSSFVIAGSLVVAASLAACSNSSLAAPGVPGSQRAAAGSTVGLWVTLPSQNELLGLTVGGKTLIDTVAVKHCTGPAGLKVDASRNVWIACNAAKGGDSGALQEYAGTGTLTAQYISKCPSNFPTGSCSKAWSSDFNDVANNGSSACGVASAYESKESPSEYIYGSGLICWNENDPSGTSVVYPAWQCNQSGSCTGSDCGPICEAWGGDMDPSGNVWFSYYGKSGSCVGGGLAEYDASTGQIGAVQSPCLLKFPGGVYVSNGGTVLNAIDQDARLIYQFDLPVTSSSTPVRTLGPTKTNASGLGDPIFGSFNKADNEFVIGDVSWIDVGHVGGKNNHWLVVTNSNFSAGVGAAAYSPSDK
jgi:hypothetical protein